MLETLFDMVAGPRECNFIEQRLLDRCFRLKFAKYLKNTFFHRTPPVTASELLSSYAQSSLAIVVDGVCGTNSGFRVG